MNAHEPEIPLAPRPGVLDRTSIAIKLPLAAATLIMIIAVAMVTGAYFTMRNDSARIANNRLDVLAKYMSDAFATSTGTFSTQLRTMAANDTLVAFMQSPTPANRARAESLFAGRGRGGRGAGGAFALQVRDAGGNVLMAVGNRAERLSAAAGNDSFPRVERADTTAAGKLRLVADSLAYPLVARIGTTEPMGYLVQWRQVSLIPRLGSLMGNLLGSEGAMYFANADGSAWTDFTSVTPPPTGMPSVLEGNVRYTRPAPRGDVFAAAHAIPGTPWIWTVEFPASSVLGPSTRFLHRLTLIAILAGAMTLFVAWRLSRRLATPLLELTAAADAIAAGRRGRSGPRFQTVRRDELGRLGISFDTMAAQVDESHQRLEEKVSQRTEALNRAMKQLQDAQESLVRKEKLALLGQLASGVGHELRNPLGVMSNAIYYLQMVQADAPADVREYLGILQHQVALSGKIVTDLLDLSRVGPAQRQPVTLRSIAESQLERVTDWKTVTVEQDFPESLPMVMVDPVHAGQVVYNLVTNAMQAMSDEGGTIRLQGRSRPDGIVHLEVSDSGPGVSPDLGDKIFEPLFTTKARGIGLGLAVSRSLAQANGGDLRLDGTRSGGATFIFIMLAAESAS